MPPEREALGHRRGETRVGEGRSTGRFGPKHKDEVAEVARLHTPVGSHFGLGLNASVRVIQAQDSGPKAGGSTVVGWNPLKARGNGACPAPCLHGGMPRLRQVAGVGESLSLNVQRETTFPQGMSRRQAALPFR